LPTVLLEALALKKPVISTDCISGPREILGGSEKKSFDNFGIELAKYGLLVRVNDETSMSNAFRVLYEQENLREMLANIGEAKAKEFDIYEVAKLYAQKLE
jgi:glycosyltransferase involved in cell wall biosynthesis